MLRSLLLLGLCWTWLDVVILFPRGGATLVKYLKIKFFQFFFQSYLCDCGTTWHNPDATNNKIKDKSSTFHLNEKPASAAALSSKVINITLKRFN